LVRAWGHFLMRERLPSEQFFKVGSKQGIDITGSMQHPSYLDALLSEAIENDVVANGETAEVWGQFGAEPSHLWL
jgi:hypothetical protein